MSRSYLYQSPKAGGFWYEPCYGVAGFHFISAKMTLEMSCCGAGLKAMVETVLQSGRGCALPPQRSFAAGTVMLCQSSEAVI